MSMFYYLAEFRWKLFRLASLLTLGKLSGETMLGVNMLRDLDEALAEPNVRKHVLNRTKLSSAYVQEYDYPPGFPDYLQRTQAFDDKNAYLLSDVVVSPKKGVVWFPEGRIIQQSVSNIPFFYFFGGIKETLLPVGEREVTDPICPLASYNCYYHQLFEGLLPVLQGRSLYPAAKILASKMRPSYLNGMLEFFGIDESQIIETERPLHVSQCVLVPKWVNSGYTRQSDVDFLRSQISSRINGGKQGEKIYISRSLAKSRALSNESEFEAELSKLGFRICHFEKMTFTEQMETIHSASIVIAPHGSGEADMIAARPGTRWIEILSEDWFVTCYAKLAVQLGLDYAFFLTVSSEQGCEIPISEILKAI